MLRVTVARWTMASSEHPHNTLTPPDEVARLQDEIARIWEQSKKTVVLITNDVDEALLLADREGASVIVTAGAGGAPVDAGDAPAGTAGTGPGTAPGPGSRLVDAGVVALLHRPRISDLQVGALVLAALLALGAATATTALGQTALSLLAASVEGLWVALRDLVTGPGG